MLLFGFPPNEVDDSHETTGTVNAKKYIRNFLLGNSFQGIGNVFRPYGLLKKIIWLLIVGASVFGFVFEIEILLAKLLPWTPNTSVSYVRNSQLYFPAVTLCNNNPYISQPIVTHTRVKR